MKGTACDYSRRSTYSGHLLYPSAELRLKTRMERQWHTPHLTHSTQTSQGEGYAAGGIT